MQNIKQIITFLDKDQIKKNKRQNVNLKLSVLKL